ncbi:MAG: LysM domain protein [Thermoleophilia bacterium]|nr:LysM domain protein [Thermoleophilia bacterium]
MSNSISSSASTLPTSATAGIGAPPSMPIVGGGGTAVTGQPLIAGDAQATDAALTPARTGSIVDAAIAAQLGTDVTGGGAPAAEDDPRNGIPAFVRRYLPSSADEGATQQGAPGKGNAPQQGVQQGWAWASCGIPAQYPPATCGPEQSPPSEPAPELPPTKDELPPAPPGKGEPPMKTPPAKGELPPAPPGKGQPPSKGEPPSKTPPTKGEPPTKTPPTKSAPVDPVEDKHRPKTYTVKSGDWLSKIAPRFGLTWQELYAANKDKISDPDRIYPGQVLTIPPKKSTPQPPSKPPTKPPTKPPVPGAPGKPPVPTKPPSDEQPPVPTKPPTPTKPPVVKPPVVKPPVVEPPVVDPPETPGPDAPPPGGTSDGTLPSAPPTPDTDGLPPALPSDR